MEAAAKWNPLTDWKHADIPWIRVGISKQDLGRFTKRSNARGLLQAGGFLLLIGATGSLSYYAFIQRYWVLLAFCLYVHGTFYSMFGAALHELSHNTVFASRALNVGTTALYGLLYWPKNPHFYRLSHQKYHHRYTLYQGSDGEDAPNYVKLAPRFVFGLFAYLVHPKALLQNLWRLFTLTPLSKGWRGRGFAFDTWEQFVWNNASPAEKRQVRRIGAACLVVHVVFVAASIYLGYWFVPVLVTLAPFYGVAFLDFVSGIHQHAACEPNNPDFRICCADVVVDPLTSFLYWHMEYHIEHHMFAAIPCYNLKRFARFVADQLPPMKAAVPRVFELNRVCQQKYGSYKAWRDGFGKYKGF
jgi:fatty acid desaturase